MCINYIIIKLKQLYCILHFLQCVNIVYLPHEPQFESQGFDV